MADKAEVKEPEYWEDIFTARGARDIESDFNSGYNHVMDRLKNYQPLTSEEHDRIEFLSGIALKIHPNIRGEMPGFDEKLAKMVELGYIKPGEEYFNFYDGATRDIAINKDLEPVFEGIENKLSYKKNKFSEPHI